MPSPYRLTYAINKRIPPTERTLKSILDFQARVNERLGLVHERLSLAPVPAVSRPSLTFPFVRLGVADRVAPAPTDSNIGPTELVSSASAIGSTRAPTLWVAHLVAAFLRHVSREFPDLIFGDLAGRHRCALEPRVVQRCPTGPAFFQCDGTLDARPDGALRALRSLYATCILLETHLHMKERPPGSPVETPGPNEQEQRQREAAREWIRAVEEEFLGSDARLHELLGYVKGTTPEGESLRIEFEGAIRQLHRRLGRLYRERLGISDEIWQEAIDS